MLAMESLQISVGFCYTPPALSPAFRCMSIEVQRALVTAKGMAWNDERLPIPKKRR